MNNNQTGTVQSMNAFNFLTNFENIEIDPHCRKAILLRLSYLRELVPIHSFFKLKLKKINNHYVGNLKVNSRQISFFSSSIGENPFSLYQKLENEVLVQIKAWKNTRFDLLKTVH